MKPFRLSLSDGSPKALPGALKRCSAVRGSPGAKVDTIPIIEGPQSGADRSAGAADGGVGE
jgi:hypothetical protein